jgi:multidrug efflux pump
MAMLPGALLFMVSAAMMSVVMGSLHIARAERPVQAGYRRTPFGWFINLLVANPVMPLVVIAAVAGFVLSVFTYFGANNNGVEFFVETEPEQAIVYVRARGNLSIEEMDALVAQAEEIVLEQEGVRDVFAFAGDGGLNNNTGGVSAPSDTIGQIQVDLEPWGTRPDGNLILEQLQSRLDVLPGIQTEILAAGTGTGFGQARRPAPVRRQLGRAAGRHGHRARAFRTRPGPDAGGGHPARCPASTGRSTSMSRPRGATAPTWRPWARWCSW